MLKDIIIAIQSYYQAHQFIVKHRLWKWILIPGIIYALLFSAGIYLFWISSGNAIDLLFSVTGLKKWMFTLEESWLKFLFIFGQDRYWQKSKISSAQCFMANRIHLVYFNSILHSLFWLVYPYVRFIN